VDKKKTTEEGKPILICSDSEDEKDDENEKEKENEKDDFTELLSRYVEYSTYTNLRQVLGSSEKNLKETFLKEWTEGSDEMDIIVFNPLFGSRAYSRAIHQSERVTTSKQEDRAEKLYRYQVLIPVKMRNLEWEQTVVVDEDVPLPMNEKEIKEKKKWGIILSEKGI